MVIVSDDLLIRVNLYIRENFKSLFEDLEKYLETRSEKQLDDLDASHRTHLWKLQVPASLKFPQIRSTSGLPRGREMVGER